MMHKNNTEICLQEHWASNGQLRKDVDRIEVMLVHYDRIYRLKMVADEVGVPLLVQDLAKSIEEKTGLPQSHQRIYIHGEEIMLCGKNLTSPMQLVGIRDRTKIHVKADIPKFWNDPENRKFEDLKSKIEKIKQHMDKAIFEVHKISVKETPGFRQKAERLVETLLKCSDQMKALNKQIYAVNVLPANRPSVRQAQNQISRTLHKRLEEINSITYGLRQSELYLETKHHHS